MKHSDIAAHTGSNVFVTFNNGEAVLGRLLQGADGKSFKVGRYGAVFTARVVSVMHAQVVIETPVAKTAKKTTTRKAAAPKRRRKPASKS